MARLQCLLCCFLIMRNTGPGATLIIMFQKQYQHDLQVITSQQCDWSAAIKVLEQH